MFDPPGIECTGAVTFEEICEEAPTIQVWMNGQQKPVEFRADSDEVPEEDEDEEDLELGQLEQLLVELDGNTTED